MSRLEGHAEWGNKAGKWVWLVADEDEAAVARECGLAATYHPGGFAGIERDDVTPLAGQVVPVLFCSEDAEAAYRACAVLDCVCVPRPLPIRTPPGWEPPDGEPRHYDFLDWCGDVRKLRPNDREAVRKALWAAIRGLPAYYPGWGTDSEFERLQRVELEKFRAKGGRPDADAIRALFVKQMDCFFDGLRLDAMAAQGAALAAAVQYVCEELLRLPKAGEHE